MLNFSRMSRGCFLIFALCIGCVVKNQPVATYQARDYVILIRDIQIMDMDHLGNLYLVDDHDRVFKFDTTGVMLHTVVNNNLGHIHSIDVGNPFKILLFYKDQQTLVIVDKTLSEMERIILPDWELDDVTAAALSPDNALWVFDGTNKILIKMDDKGNPLLKSDPFDILDPPVMRPDLILDAKGYLLLLERGKDIAVFNDFGNYLNPLSAEGSWLTLSGDQILELKNGEIQLSALPDRNKTTSYLLADREISGEAKFFAGQFYAFDDKGIYLLNVDRK